MDYTLYTRSKSCPGWNQEARVYQGRLNNAPGGVVVVVILLVVCVPIIAIACCFCKSSKAPKTPEEQQDA